MLFSFLKIILLLFMATTAQAAQWAKVTSDKAVIYADQQRIAPIGFIKKGKKIRVGEVVRNNGTVLPIAVQGKVAYINIEDLDISYSQKVLDSPAQRLAQKAKEKSHENRFALTYNGMATTLNTSEGDESVLLNGGGVRGYIIDLKKRKTWRMSLDFVTTTINSYGLDISSLTAEFAKNIIQTGPYDFHVYAGASVIPYAQFSREDDFKQNGYGAGVSAGLEMIFKFNDTIGLHFDGNYQYNQLYFPLRDEVLDDLGITEFEPSLHGFKFSAAISFNYL